MPIASPAASQTRLAVSNETGRQGDVTLTGLPDTWKWDDPHAGIEEENWERPRGWNGGKGKVEAAYQLSENWVTGQGRWLNWKIPPSEKRRNAHLCSQQRLLTPLSDLSLSSDRPKRTNPFPLREHSTAEHALLIFFQNFWISCYYLNQNWNCQFCFSRFLWLLILAHDRYSSSVLMV